MNREFTVWESLKYIAAIWLIWWGTCLLPKKSKAHSEMLAFLQIWVKKNERDFERGEEY